MFDIGWIELLIIAVVAIIVIGPKDFPRMLRTLGRYIGMVRRMAGDFRVQFDEAIRESEFDQLRKDFEDVRSIHPVTAVKETIEPSLKPVQAAAKIKAGIEAKPAARSPRKSAKPASKSTRRAAAGKTRKARGKSTPRGRSRAPKAGA